MEKTLSKALLTVYILILIWLVLFKLQFDLSSIIHRNYRSVNLTPFAYAIKLDVILNWLFFLPFGVLLNVVYKNTGFIIKLLVIIAFSLSAELLQYIFAIGVSDITDLITNSLGGLAGLLLYMLFNTFIDDRKLDRFVVILGIMLLLIFLFIHGSHYFRRTLFR